MERYRRFLEGLNRIMGMITIMVSIVIVGAIVVDYGFPLNPSETILINKVYAIGWWTYVISFILQLLHRWSQIKKKSLSLTSLVGVMLCISALPKIFTLPSEAGWVMSLWNFLESKYFIVALLGVFSLIELSRAITKLVNKKTNPALLVVLCFAGTIMFGALLLLLPRSTVEYFQLPIIDALFTSTSAVCVTGLSTVDVSSTFTLEGQIIIALLIQIGGLGIMTITTFFALFFMDGLGLFSQFALKDMISSGAETLIATLMYVLGFTIVIEMFGAFFIWLSIHPLDGMTLQEEIFFSIFHSVSAFCNAGFSTLEGGLGNEVVFLGHNMFYIIISVLIILGGIGFPILINLRRQFGYYLSVLFHRFFQKDKPQARYSHLVDLNTYIVLKITVILVVFGSLLILMLEGNRAFADLSFVDKIVQSFFNAVVPRTAGFNSVATSDFSRVTILLLMVLMWIGGASQSTAGGVKVNTLAVAYASMKSLITGQRTTELYNREITYNTIRRALAVIAGSMIVISIFYVALLMLEPHITSTEALFETISAFSTVGSSLGITSSLSSVSKFLLVLLMFIGRVGFITVMMSIIPRREQNKFRLPKEDIIIN